MYHVDIRTVIWRWPNFHLSEALQWRSWGHANQKVFSRRKKIVGSLVVNQETTVHFFLLQPFFRFSFFLLYILYSDNAVLMFCSGWGTWLGTVFGAYGSVGTQKRLEICIDIVLKNPVILMRVNVETPARTVVSGLAAVLPSQTTNRHMLSNMNVTCKNVGMMHMTCNKSPYKTKYLWSTI